jgi:hypothetical protein
VKVPGSIVPWGLRAVSPSVNLSGAVAFGGATGGHLVMVDAPKTMAACTSAAWITRECQVRRGFESWIDVRMKGPENAWGGFNFVVQNRSAVPTLGLGGYATASARAGCSGC